MPAVSVIAPVEVRALPSVHSPPAPLNVIGPPNETPLVVSVFPVVVALKLTVPALVQVVPASKVIDPLTTNVVEPAKVTVPADKVISRQTGDPAKVTVYVPG